MTINKLVYKPRSYDSLEDSFRPKNCKKVLNSLLFGLILLLVEFFYYGWAYNRLPLSSYELCLSGKPEMTYYFSVTDETEKNTISSQRHIRMERPTRSKMVCAGMTDSGIKDYQKCLNL